MPMKKTLATSAPAMDQGNDKTATPSDKKATPSDKKNAPKTNPKLKTAKTRPTVCLVIGMAGSGKTTFLQRLNAHVHQHNIPSYIINLDPAVTSVPYGANIDIRDTVCT